MYLFDFFPQIIATGHSRIPVYEGEKANIVGALLVKKLVLIGFESTALVRFWPLLSWQRQGGVHAPVR